MNPNTLCTPEQAAGALNVSTKLLKNWRYYKRGPKFLKLGRGLVRYRLADLEAFAGHELSLPTEHSESAAPVTATA